MPFPIPDPIETDDWICVTLKIPNVAGYRANFIGHMIMLAKWWNHERDENQSAKKVAAEWMKSFLTIQFEDCMVDNCCPDDNIINNLIYNQMQQDAAQILELLDDGIDPRSFAPNAPSSFDSDTNDTGDDTLYRGYALCRAVKQYVYRCLYGYAGGINAIADIFNAIKGAFPVFDPIPAFLFTAANEITKAHLLELINDCNAIAKVTCCMLDGLRGNTTALPTFKSSVNDCGFDFGTHEAEIAFIVNVSNQVDANYRAFVKILHANYSGAKTGVGSGGANASDCACECCEDELILEDFAAFGSTITPMGNCIYRVQQNTPVSGFYYASIAESTGKCLDITYADGFTLQGIANSTIYDCAGTVIYDSVGGFVPSNNISKVSFRVSPEPIDSYFKITEAV